MSEATRNIAREKSNILLWAGVLAGPAAWMLHLQISYSLVGTACDTGQQFVMHLVTLGALLLAGTGAAISWRSWKRLPEGPMDEGDAKETRKRFMALFGLVMSLSFVLVIVAAEIPNWVLRACD
jgi:hypothetical protein